MFPWGNSTPFEYMTGQDQQINENPSSSCFSNFPSHLQICDDDDFLISTHFVKHRHKEHIPSLPPYHSPLPPVDGIVQAYDKTGAREPKSVEEEGSNSKDSNTKASAPEAKKSSEIPVKTRSSSTVKKPSSAGGGSTAKRRRTAAAAATTTTTTRTRQPPGAPRRRIGKKDRHSKIFTAHGPRDRRMRLSLQIARKFFDLQDMLGFDKASKTIEWLFTMSKSAIEEITASMPQKSMGCGAAAGRGASASSTTITDCIVSMGMELEIANIEAGPHHHSHVMWENKGTDHPNISTRKKSSYSSSARRHPIMIVDDLVKERREKARARARARTDEKRLKKERPEERNSRLELSSPEFTNPMNSCSEKLGSSSSTLETAGEESAGCPSQEFNSSIIMEADQCNSPQQFLLENQMASVDIIENLVGTTTPSIYDPCQLLRDGVSSGIRYDVDDDFLDILTAGNWVSTTESTTSVSLGYGEMMTSLIMTGDVGRVQGQNPSSIFILQSD